MVILVFYTRSDSGTLNMASNVPISTELNRDTWGPDFVIKPRVKDLYIAACKDLDSPGQALSSGA